MLDFSLPSDFGSIATDLDFSLSDVAIQSRDDGIENERYSRPKIYENTLGMVEYEHAADFAEQSAKRKTRRKSKQGFTMICLFRSINGRGEKAR
jgi:hypothetical protein